VERGLYRDLKVLNVLVYLAELKGTPRAVRLRTPAALDALPGVSRMEQRDDTFTLNLDDITPQELLRVLVERNVPVEAFEVATVPLEEIFIAVVKEEEYDA